MTNFNKLNLLAILFVIFVSCNNENNNQQHDDDSLIEMPEVKNDTDKLVVPDKPSGETEIKRSLKLEDESIVFSFKTKKGKTMNIVLGKDEKYLTYRFGTNDKVELQFPENLKNTFEQFTYNYYFRGGGAMNMGLDLNYLSFNGETHQFVIFDEWSADEGGEGTTAVGIKIIDLSTKNEVIIEGDNTTKKGSLVDFRYNGLVKSRRR